MSKSPKVSIISITYNQEKFIKQALDSFVIQQCDFSFEVIVADDGSTDGTRDIIREYAQKYPDIIKPLLREKNMGAWKNFVDAIGRAEGEYVALCEGDDYWVDPNKLQLQVDFLEKHPSYSMCFHPVRVFFENHEMDDSIFPTSNNQSDFTFEALLKANFIQTNSVMYRKQHYKEMATDVIPGDWYLHLYHAQFGKIGFIDKVMSTYRKHSGGIWWGALGDQKEFWKKNGLQHLRLYKELIKMFGKNRVYKEIILKNAGKNTSSIIEADDSKDGHLITALATDSPEFIQQAVLNNLEEIKEKNDEIKENKILIYIQSEEIKSALIDIKRIEEDRVNILNSWNYRIGKLVLYPPKSSKIYLKKVLNNINRLSGKK